MPKPFTKPAAYWLYCSVPHADKPGELYTFRVGQTNDPAALPGMVASDKAAMRNTFGGLIEPGQTHGRTYRAFKAEWTEITF